MEAIKEPRSRKAFLISAALSLGLGFACSETVLSFLFGADSLADGAGNLASRGRGILLSLSGAFVVLGVFNFKISPRVRAAGISTVFALFGFEALGAPFIGSDTTIFIRDESLGWRLRPGGHDDWLGCRVRINTHGMRGALPREPPGRRFLFLGDSFVFGAFLAHDSQTITEQANQRFAKLQLDGQSLNAGVGGWAPWQERAWLESEGSLLSPDVVLVNLVLNDATEPLSLEAFGGAEQGFQLDRARGPGIFRSSTWATALRRWRREARDPSGIESSSRAEALGVYELLRSPHMPASRSAWARHMDEVELLVAAIRKIGAVPVVVMHPYTVQFESPDLWWPQLAIESWCSEEGVPCLDVGRAIALGGIPPLELYHDAVHPNAMGASHIAEVIVEFLSAEDLLH